jgi:hypothetical protein
MSIIVTSLKGVTLLLSALGMISEKFKILCHKRLASHLANQVTHVYELALKRRVKLL